jgi:hypothetical protein
MVTVANRLENRNEIAPALEGDWFDDSDRPDAEWNNEIEVLGFPGYLEREGMERFAGL